MGGVADLVNNITGKLFGGDATDAASARALAIQKKQADKAGQEARAAAAEQRAAEENQRKKRANVKASGRQSTILAGENSGGQSLLGG